MMDDQWRDRLSEYLDGHLSADEAGRLEEHLESCGSCRRALEELRAVVARARSLEPRPPARDLWPGIERGIRRGSGGDAEREQVADVVDLDEARRVGRRRRSRARDDRGRWRGRWVRLSVPQLAAAAVALLLMGGAGTWAAAPLLRGDAGPAVAAGEPGEAGGDVSLVASGPATATERQASRELEALEEILTRHRERLDPNTVRIMEKNLGIIDRAIRESRAALAVDPGNPYLEEHLQRALERKLDYVREARDLLQAS